MHQTTRHRAGLVAIFFVLLMATSPVLGAVGTIILNNGDQFDKVEYTVVQLYKVVKFKVDGKERAASFADIRTILDQGGNDITTQVLRGDYRKEEAAPAPTPSPEVSTDSPAAKELWLESEHPVYTKQKTRPFDLAFVMEGNFTLPAGDYYEGVGTGLGFGVSVVIPVSRNLALRGTVSKAGSKLEDSFVEKILPYEFTLVSDESEFSAWRYLFSVQYQQSYKPDRFDKGYWYLYSGLGATTNGISGHAVAREQGTGDLYTFTIIPDKSRFTTTVGVGGVSMLSRTIGLSYGGNLDLIYVGSNGNGGIQYGYNFDLRCGVIFHLSPKDKRD
ncbi:MAG: hypothetical protein IPH75_00860 [bacterium]|nr:hypothetical protein [bacterium]